jgi:hypothetical protein
MELSKECIELIEEQLIKKCYLNHESAFESIVEQCLTNPSILKSANLYTQEEMDKACKDAYVRAINFYGVPPIPMSVKDENITGKR